MENNGNCCSRAKQNEKRPVAAFLHMIVYVGFVIINIELIEIIVDGIFEHTVS